MLDSSGVFPTASRAPNKALFTISARTSRILVANKFACEVFGYQQSELVDAKIQRLFSEPYQSKQRALVEQHINSDGDTVLLSGKVMDAVRSDGTEFPVSVWMKGVKTEDEPRVIVVVEPVARANAHFTLNPPTKEILACDENFATLFGYLEPHEVVGKRITDFVPSVVIPEIIGNEDETLQQLTGRSKANTVFPLTVTFTAKECPQANTEDDDRVQVVLRGTLIVYSMLSGMLSFLPSGKIHGSNEQFALMMFGYTKEEMANMVQTCIRTYVLTMHTGILLSSHSAIHCWTEHIHVCARCGCGCRCGCMYVGLGMGVGVCRCGCRCGCRCRCRCT
jgi:PAS domain-containing serine/threonine kinase